MVIDRWLCGLFGHDWLRAFGRNRLFVRCLKCGSESVGITIR